MADLLNTNEHAVYVEDPNSPRPDKLRRLGPGVIEANPRGEYAQNLAATDGIVANESAEADDYRARQAVNTPGDGPGHQLGLKERVQDAQIAARTAAVVAPLQQVIGDDEAPAGPPSGTVTTKIAVSDVSQRQRDHFAPGEARPGDEDLPGVTGAAAEQARARGRAEEVVRAVLPDTTGTVDPQIAGLGGAGEVPEATPEEAQLTTDEVIERAADQAKEAADAAETTSGQDETPGAELAGKALKARAEELNIEGRKSMRADELRKAVAKAERKG